MIASILGYGAYIPRYRIKAEEIAKVWGQDPDRVKLGLLVESKSVPGPDEDTATIAFEAAMQAIERAGIDKSLIGAVFAGSESHPYAVKPTGTILASALGLNPKHLRAASFEFACKAGTEAIQAVIGLINAGLIKYGLAIGADTAQGRPSDPLEYTAAAGGAAYVLGPKGDSKAIAEIERVESYVTDTPDFRRRQGAPYPEHGVRFTGEPAYFHHIINSVKLLLEKLGRDINEYDRFAFHSPNGKFVRNVARRLGIKDLSRVVSLDIVRKCGNFYSGSTLVGIARALDKANPGDKILAASFGSGAGSDAFSIVVKDRITEVKSIGKSVDRYLNRAKYIDYGTYARYRGILVMD